MLRDQPGLTSGEIGDLLRDLHGTPAQFRAQAGSEG
jgi:hypothetical protein